MRADRYQYSLIALGLIATAMLGLFFYREAFPEYRIYQNNYLALEKFRSGYTHQPVPLFKEGIHQIVHERADNGPADIQRCTSCHVTLDLEYFSPTALQYDANGNLQKDSDGVPLKKINADFIWTKLDEKIEELKSSGKEQEALELEKLKTAHVGEQSYDVTKVLAMHPLIGKETRPFEYHPVDEYGCIACHSGNGYGLTTQKAHGPIYDGQYEAEFMGPEPHFVEKDPQNDPAFSKVFNSKPSDKLLFQTTPLLVGNLIEANCMQCHTPPQKSWKGVSKQADLLISQKEKELKQLEDSLISDENLIAALFLLRYEVNEKGVAAAQQKALARSQDYTLAAEERHASKGQSEWLLMAVGGAMGLQKQDSQVAKDVVLQKIDAELLALLGGDKLVNALKKQLDAIPRQQQDFLAVLAVFIDNNAGNGSIFIKKQKVSLEKDELLHYKQAQNSFGGGAAVSILLSDIDKLTAHYHRGEQLFLGQACYACHKVAGFARGGVGPELSYEGNVYPWYIKEKIVWPQSDLKTSTMPNFHLDHEELEDLMTYLLKQKGAEKNISAMERKLFLQQWESGAKMPWEQTLAPSKVYDLKDSMKIFATEGCAACHRLKGFSSNIGYQAELQKDFNQNIHQQQSSWFQKLFPELSTAKDLTKTINEKRAEIDEKIVDGVRTNSILEEIDQQHPGLIESFYTPFKYVRRSKDSYFESKIAAAKTEEEKQKYKIEWNKWQETVHSVLFTFIQEYGLGRLIGPKPNWSGVFRTDEWLMEHFHNPSAHVPRSIMPVFPFEDSKFYALTYMLDELAKRNTKSFKSLWAENGFSPEKAYELLCSQCHGTYLQGDGPVAQWIYPIPKNLRNAEFLRNLTRQQALQSILHGVRGTPMPPWGEVAQDKRFKADGPPVLTAAEASQLVDWLFARLPGETVIRSESDVPKWHYMPSDIIDELEQENKAKEILKKAGNDSKAKKSSEQKESEHKPFVTPATLGVSFSALKALKPLLAIFSLPIPLHNQPESDESFDEPPLKVEDLFDSVTTPKGSDQIESTSYYIKKSLYTPENLESGRRFFEIHCAYCHGQQADGAGTRADAMTDAKPRMLINLDWLQTRDDLRLLRSIKYGVSGTAMTPWGDMTSALQRLQLVMYIRSLSSDRQQKEQLNQLLYRTYFEAALIVDTARALEYKGLENNQREYEALKTKISSLEQLDNAKEAADLIEKAAKTKKKQQEKEKIDQNYIQLKKSIFAEEKLYEEAGKELMPYADEALWKKFLALIELNTARWQAGDQRLILTKNFADTELEANKLQKAIISEVEKKIQILEKNNDESEEDKKLLETLKKLKNHLIETFASVQRTQKLELSLYQAIAIVSSPKDF